MFQWQYHVIFLVIGIRIFFPDHHQVLLNEQNKLNGNQQDRVLQITHEL
jgi:hypothetical protein